MVLFHIFFVIFTFNNKKVQYKFLKSTAMGVLNIFKSKGKDKVKIQKSDTADEWIVTKGFSILYIGTKEMCKTFIETRKSTAMG